MIALLYQRFPDPDEYTDYLAKFETAVRKPSEMAQAFSVRVMDLAGKAYPTLDWRLKKETILRRYIRGQPFNIHKILIANHPENLTAAIRTISRMDQFEMEAEVAQSYAMNLVRHSSESSDLTVGHAV